MVPLKGKEGCHFDTPFLASWPYQEQPLARGGAKMAPPPNDWGGCQNGTPLWVAVARPMPS